MKKPLNILSIDWDYFINATKTQRVMEFPDPNDNLSTELNSFIWANRYASNDNLADIGVTVSEFDEIKEYLTEVRKHFMSPNIKVMITNSHKFIYEFITDNIGSEFPINLFHIDYHTDCYCNDLGRELDCGNWVDYLCNFLSKRQQKFSKIFWLGRQDSDSDEYLPKIMRKMDCYDPTVDDLSNMIDSCFHGDIPDLIFICKSNPWSPPHLDYKFDDIVNIAKRIGRVRYSSDINIRYTDSFKNTVEELRKSNKETLDKYRKE